MKLLEEALNRKGYEYVLNLEKQFDKAGREIEKELALWYRRFADENNMDLAEAKRLLNSRELEEFRWSVEEYIEKGSSLDPQWKKQLENASIRVHVSRLDSIRLQLQQKAEELYGNQLDGLNRVLAGIYTEGYYHSAFEIAKGTGVGHSLMSIDGRRIEKVLSKPWSTDMRTFRDRCWTDKEALVRKVNTDLTQMIMRGEPPDEAIKAIAKDFKVSKSKAGRLVMTESAAFASISQKDCYDDLEVEKYRIVETLDNSTCELCADLDSKVYKMSEYQVGLTAPPFHPWCRGYTAPAFDDWEELGITPTRAARDPKTGKTVQVEDMTYREWKEKFVEPPLTNAEGKPIIRVNRTLLKSKPNTITQITNAKGGIERNYYDDSGTQLKQVANNGHGHKKEEAMGLHGEHAHDYRWDESGKLHRSVRELSEQERKENSDIL